VPDLGLSLAVKAWPRPPENNVETRRLIKALYTLNMDEH